MAYLPEYLTLIRISLLVFSILHLFPYLVKANTPCRGGTESKVTATVVNSIFKKYGYDNGNLLNETSLRKLMSSLSLGSIKVVCRSNDTECLKDRLKQHRLPTDKKRGSLPNSDKLPRSKRNVDRKREHELDWNKHLQKCMSSKNLSLMYKINSSAITKKDFIDMCPTLVQQVDEGVCIHHHKLYPPFIPQEGPPPASSTWGFGFLAITLCSLLSLTVIAMVPCLNKSFYEMIMAYLVALAVGTLAGDAMLHLIPHAFIEGANLAAGVVMSEEQRLKQHYSQVWKAMFVLAGIYMFFLVEQVMKLKGKCCGKGKQADIAVALEEPTDGTDVFHAIHGQEAPDHGHGHSHGGDKAITGETKISSVAWMVVVGDGFHNFSDGLAVGAAFSASISSGVSTTIAIFCHELPHELGDFAILLKAGMTIRQAIVYNLVSAVLAYIGLAIGIVAGEGELGRHIILCITAGLFLYISLVDMMGELIDQEIVRSQFCTSLCQHLGLISGVVIMLIISLYEHDM